MIASRITSALPSRVMTTASISRNIQAEMARKGRTHEQLAADVNIPIATWRRRMRTHGWTVAEVKLVATALRVTRAVLIGEEAA